MAFKIYANISNLIYKLHHQFIFFKVELIQWIYGSPASHTNEEQHSTLSMLEVKKIDR